MPSLTTLRATRRRMGSRLLGQVHRAHAPFADRPDDLITAEVVIAACRRRGIDGLGSQFVRSQRAVEGALDQTLRAQSRGTIGIQFRSALRAISHFDPVRNSHFMPFATGAVILNPRLLIRGEPDRTRRRSRGPGGHNGSVVDLDSLGVIAPGALSGDAARARIPLAGWRRDAGHGSSRRGASCATAFPSRASAGGRTKLRGRRTSPRARPCHCSGEHAAQHQVGEGGERLRIFGEGCRFLGRFAATRQDGLVAPPGPHYAPPPEFLHSPPLGQGVHAIYSDGRRNSVSVSKFSRLTSGFIRTNKLVCAGRATPSRDRNWKS